jgi:hypothetical protein
MAVSSRYRLLAQAGLIIQTVFRTLGRTLSSCAGQGIASTLAYEEPLFVFEKRISGRTSSTFRLLDLFEELYSSRREPQFSSSLL